MKRFTMARSSSITNRWAPLFAAVTGATMLAYPLLAGEPPPKKKPTDLKVLPANQWSARSLSGWDGKSSFGLCAAGERGILVYDGVSRSKEGYVQDVKTVRIQRLDATTGIWTEEVSGQVEQLVPGDPAHSIEGLNGVQLCYDSDRETLVAITCTGLGMLGRTVEFDLGTKKTEGFNSDPSPPVATTASLCYDPDRPSPVLPEPKAQSLRHSIDRNRFDSIRELQ